MCYQRREFFCLSEQALLNYLIFVYVHKSINFKLNILILMLMSLVELFQLTDILLMKLINLLARWFLGSYLLLQCLADDSCHLNIGREEQAISTPINNPRDFQLIDKQAQIQKFVECPHCFVLVCDQNLTNSVAVLKRILDEPCSFFDENSHLFWCS